MKRFWYHITIDNWPSAIVLTPRKGGQNLGAEEGKRRPKVISVAPTVEQCFAAIPYSDYPRKSWKVYRTQEEVEASLADPSLIDDVHITEEHWIASRTKFIRILQISSFEIKEKFPIHGINDMHQKAQLDVIHYCKKFLKTSKKKI